MWQRFTERARKVVFYAQEEAQRLSQGYVAPEHLLLGLLRDPDTVAIRVLNNVGVSPEAIREELEETLQGLQEAPSMDMTLTPRAKWVIDCCYEEARNLNNNYIGTEHLLLGLIKEGDSLAARTLAKFEVSLEKARKEVLALQDATPESKGAFAMLKERFLGKATSSTTETTPNLPVTYDLQALHPVDQLLVALLSSRDTPLGERLRQRCQSLDWTLAAIVAGMTEASDNDATLADVLKTANQDARHGTIELDGLYRAAFTHTTDATRAMLTGLQLEPVD